MKIMKNSRKGQFELPMMIFMLAIIVTVFILLIIGLEIQGKQSYRVRRNIWEPNKYSISLNSLLQVGHTRTRLINYSCGVRKQKMAKDINSTLEKMFPDRRAVLKFSGTTFGNGIQTGEDTQEFNKTSRTIFLPFHQSEKVKLKVWVGPG